METVQRLDRRAFSYVAGDLESGYFVNFIFSAEPALIAKLRGKLKLDNDVYRQHYQKLRARKTVAAA